MENDNSQLHYMQISVDHMEAMKYLTDEQRGIVLRFIFAYFQKDMNESEIIAAVPKEHNIILPVFSQLRLSIDRSRKSYEERCRINRENGKKGGAPKGNQNAKKNAEADIEISGILEEPAAAAPVTYVDVRQYQIDNRIGCGSDASEFSSGFEKSGTKFPPDWQKVYRAFVKADEADRERFLNKLSTGGFRDKWGAVEEINQNNQRVEKTTETSQIN